MIDVRGTSNLVRDALQLYADTQAGRADTLIGELEAEAASGLWAIQGLVDDMARQRRIWLANDMQMRLADPSTEIGGAFSRERWIEIQTLFDAFGAWLETPLAVAAGVQVAPLTIISRRGNPPAWAVQEGGNG